MTLMLPGPRLGECVRAWLRALRPGETFTTMACVTALHSQRDAVRYHLRNNRDLCERVNTQAKSGTWWRRKVPPSRSEVI